MNEEVDQKIALAQRHEILDSLHPRFTVGQTVCSKKTGLPGAGRICGIVLGRIYGQLAANHNPTPWNEQFPGWEHKCVYYVIFDELRYTVSVEEFNKQKQLGLCPDYVPYSALPKTNMIVYVEDDLESFE